MTLVSVSCFIVVLILSVEQPKLVRGIVVTIGRDIYGGSFGGTFSEVDFSNEGGDKAPWAALRWDHQTITRSSELPMDNECDMPGQKVTSLQSEGYPIFGASGYKNEGGFGFIAKTESGKIYQWGLPATQGAWRDAKYTYFAGGGYSRDVKDRVSMNVIQTVMNRNGAAALTAEGKVITWGPGHGGISSNHELDFQLPLDPSKTLCDGCTTSVQSNDLSTWNKLQSAVVSIHAGKNQFAAIKQDGSVVTWGPQYNIWNDVYFDCDGPSPPYSSCWWGSQNPPTNTAVPHGLVGATNLFFTQSAIAALKTDSTVVSWGPSGRGGNNMAYNGVGDIKKYDSYTNDVTADLTQVIDIASSHSSFLALKADGSVVAWGSAWTGGVIPQSLTSVLHSHVASITAGIDSFIAVTTDGSVYMWGKFEYSRNEFDLDDYRSWINTGAAAAGTHKFYICPMPKPKSTDYGGATIYAPYAQGGREVVAILLKTGAVHFLSGPRAGETDSSGQGGSKGKTVELITGNSEIHTSTPTSVRVLGRTDTGRVIDYGFTLGKSGSWISQWSDGLEALRLVDKVAIASPYDDDPDQICYGALKSDGSVSFGCTLDVGAQGYPTYGGYQGNIIESYLQHSVTDIVASTMGFAFMVDKPCTTTSTTTSTSISTTTSTLTTTSITTTITTTPTTTKTSTTSTSTNDDSLARGSTAGMSTTSSIMTTTATATMLAASSVAPSSSSEASPATTTTMYVTSTITTDAATMITTAEIAGAAEVSFLALLQIDDFTAFDQTKYAESVRAVAASNPGVAANSIQAIVERVSFNITSSTSVVTSGLTVQELEALGDEICAKLLEVAGNGATCLVKSFQRRLLSPEDFPRGRRLQTTSIETELISTNAAAANQAKLLAANGTALEVAVKRNSQFSMITLEVPTAPKALVQIQTKVVASVEILDPAATLTPNTAALSDALESSLGVAVSVTDLSNTGSTSTTEESALISKSSKVALLRTTAVACFCIQIIKAFS